jgi:hypothetical protein
MLVFFNERGGRELLRNQDVLNRIVCVASSVALLAAVIVSPIRSTGTTAGSARPDRTHRDFVVPLSGSSQTTAKSVPSSPLRVKAISSENEGEDERIEMVGSSSYFVFVPSPAVSFEPARALAVSGLIHSIHPLRC